MVSLTLLVALLFALVLEGTRAFSDPPAADELPTPPDARPPEAPEPPASMNWDPSWRYERRFA